MKNTNQWKIVKNPLIEDNLTNLRNKDTNRQDFCKAITNIAKLLVNSVSNDWKMSKTKIHTPFAQIDSLILKERIILIPILRAGIALLEGFKDLIPKAKIGHIGLYRNKINFHAHEYYFKIPELKNDDQVIVLDPMIATAVTAITAIKKLQKINPHCQINLVSIITSQHAKKQINQTLKKINIYTVCIDQQLNEKKYIVPGFGDAGDRFFGTE